jgi:hypothetical protein
MIFADQRDAVAELDAFLFEPKSDAANLVEHFGESVFASFVFADDLHRHFIAVRFGGVNNQLAK